MMLIANATVKKWVCRGYLLKTLKTNRWAQTAGVCFKWGEKGWDPEISSVNIFILNQGCPMNNIIPIPESP